MGLLILQALKWILWMILFLVLLILVIFSLMLLVPIRYRTEVEYKEEKTCMQGRISWLFSLVSLTFIHQGQLKTKLNILGISFYDSDKPKEKKSRKKRDAKPKKENKKSTEKTVERENTDRRQEFSASGAKEQPLGDKTEAPPPTVSVASTPKSELILMDRLKGFWEKLVGLKGAIPGVLERLKAIWQGCKDKKALLDYYREQWKRKEVQTTWKRGRNKFGKMAKSIGPRKWLLTGKLGLGDPAATGQMMAVLGIAYPFIGNHIQIRPDFEQQIIELKGFLKGRISLGSLLWQLVSLVLHRDCIGFIKLVFQEIMNNKNEEDNSSIQEVADDRQ